MSYEIVQSIKFTPDAVIFRADSNNVSPRDYSPRESPYFTAMLREQGREAVEIEIMRAYEEGNFQGRVNRFTKALDRLHAMPEYTKFNWSTNRFPYGSDEYKAFNLSRHSDAFTALLRQALYFRTPSN